MRMLRLKEDRHILELRCGTGVRWIKEKGGAYD